jgi:hypothetical protein
MNTIILYISDIHFTGKRAENEGVVINAFIRDAKKQLEEHTCMQRIPTAIHLLVMIKNHMTISGMI